MYGFHTGRLSVMPVGLDGLPTEDDVKYFWTESGEKGNKWLHANVSFNLKKDQRVCSITIASVYYILCDKEAII